MNKMGLGPWEIERQAKFRIREAAPDLLAACEAALAFWEPNGCGETSSPVAAKLRAAIAKARGDAS